MTDYNNILSINAMIPSVNGYAARRSTRMIIIIVLSKTVCSNALGSVHQRYPYEIILLPSKRSFFARSAFRYWIDYFFGRNSQRVAQAQLSNVVNCSSAPSPPIRIISSSRTHFKILSNTQMDLAVQRTNFSVPSLGPPNKLYRDRA